MDHQLTDPDRKAIVEDFLRSCLDQEAYCGQLALRGLRIAPRTLRSWLKRHGPTKDFGAEYRAIGVCRCGYVALAYFKVDTRRAECTRTTSPSTVLVEVGVHPRPI